MSHSIPTFGKSWNPKIIGFVVKQNHSEAKKMAVIIAEQLLLDDYAVAFSHQQKNIAQLVKKEVESKKKIKNLASKIKTYAKDELPDYTDLIIVLGGDGTLLGIARLMKERSVPLFGIHMGRVGFLTEIKVNEAQTLLGSLLASNRATVTERTMLEVTLMRGKKVILQKPVLNDVVLAKGSVARIIGLQVFVNKKWASTVRSDGLILSTPTGSTAYSMAAGRPIREPTLPGILVTPISPHSLTHRPLVVHEDSLIEIKIDQKPCDVFLTLDGQETLSLKEKDVIHVTKFKKHKIKIISAPERDFFTLMREKFQFGSH